MRKKFLRRMNSILLALPLVILTSCGVSTPNNPKYNVVSPDFQMSEAFAALGYVPSLVTSDYTKRDYNDFEEQEFESISYSSNLERLLDDKPKILLDYSTNEKVKDVVESYGGKYLPFPKVGKMDYLKYSDSSDSIAMPLSYSWATIKEFWKQFNGLFTKPIDENYESKIKNLEDGFNQRILKLREFIEQQFGFSNDQTITFTMWGANDGINYYPNETDYTNFGYSTHQIDWLLNKKDLTDTTTETLNFTKNYPNSNDIIYKKGPSGQGYGVQGWFFENGGVALENEVHKRFIDNSDTYKGSDFVFVKYDITQDNDPKINEIKTYFSSMVDNTVQNRTDRVIIIPDNFGFFEYSPISWDYSLNVMSLALGFDGNVKDLGVYKENIKSFKDIELNLK